MRVAQSVGETSVASAPGLWDHPGLDGTVPTAEALPQISVPGWSGYDLAHGFFGRHGGVGTGVFASLNLSHAVGDDPQVVDTNWDRVIRQLGGRLRIARMHQVHGNRVAAIDASQEWVGDADAMVTDRAGVALAVLTADCVPLLFVAPDHGVIGVAHAGWKGTLAGVAAGTVAAMRKRYGVPAEKVQVSLGPAIGVCCYEVGDDVGAAFSAMGEDVAMTVEGGNGLRLRVDLRRANAALLERVGVLPDSIRIEGPCTRCASTHFFSHRAHAGRTGRQASLIAQREMTQQK